MIERLQRVALREVWKHEAHDFTQWLEENIEVLNEAIDLNLVNIEREKKTESTFSVDLVAEDEDGKVIIENQLEKSDHDHLGKLITYLTAMQAQKAVWIVSHPRPEHVAAINWLNESTNADFYLLKIEAVRIGDSPPAPLLTVIVGPSEMGKTVGKMKQESRESHRQIEAWFTKLIQHPNSELDKNQKVRGSYPYLELAGGISGTSFSYRVQRKGSYLDVFIDLGYAKEASATNKLIYGHLQSHKEEIEKAFGEELRWSERAKSCSILTPIIEGGYESEPEKWDGCFDKLTSQMNLIHQIINPLLKSSQLKKMLANAPAIEETES